MKWSTNNLMWGRPLRSIFSVFNEKKLHFKYHHLESTDNIIIEQDLEKKTKKITNFKELKFMNFFLCIITISLSKFLELHKR